jgi:predicted Zn-dependent peptidase
LGRHQRSAQTVGGVASGYSSRYFFDETLEDYYAIPKRIDAVSKEAIVSIVRNMFADKVWGLGCLGSSGEEFAHKLQAHVSPLWQSREAPQPQKARQTV